MAIHAHPTRTVLLGTTKRLREIPVHTIEFKSAEPKLSLDTTAPGGIYDAFPIKIGDMMYTVTYTTREPIIAWLRFLPWFLLAYIPHRIRAKKLEITKDQCFITLKDIPFVKRREGSWS